MLLLIIFEKKLNIKKKIHRSDWASAKELIDILEEADQEVPDELREMKSRFEAMQERKQREIQSMGGRRSVF